MEINEMIARINILARKKRSDAIRRIRRSAHTESKTFSYPLLYSPFLFYSFPINAYRYKLPW